ncbi:hypothetical protein K439DRAFT_1636273 [Ramaria rubella]|nr:hypothetical protein K439DRAFT_1636273 [Ramaria rubella]
MKTHRDVMTGLRRQLALPENGDETWRILEYSGMIIVNIVNKATSPTEELIFLINYHSLIPLLGGVLLRCAVESKQSASWSSLVTLLKHTCTCTSPICRVRTSPAYVTALRTNLSWRWWPVLRRLRAAGSDMATKIQNEWTILGRMVSLEEAMERKKHEYGEGMQGCWWVECVNLVEPSNPVCNPELKKCSGCKKAFYCTANCQNRDWKGHKKQCTIWKTATAVH